MSKVVTAEIVEQAIQLRRSGLSIAKVAERLGVSRETVFRNTKGKVPEARRGRRPNAKTPLQPLPMHNDELSLSNRYPGHDDRIAAHTERIRDYLLARHKDNSPGLRNIQQAS
jgi:transcriptional regulator with XRE-family HTH domain